MKRLFTTTLLLLALVLSTQAQEKKTWDFTRGLSDETVANLNADTQNWSPNGTDAEGVTNNWQNAVKPSTTEPLKANGEVIAETAGLLIDIGNNKSNSIHLAQSKIRLTRKDTKVTFPQLRKGQKVTIVGRSANGTATNRGIAPVQDYLVLTDGTTTNDQCLFLGNQVEGSLGTYSFTWEVQADSEDPVDVQFRLTPEGGIDFTLFMIDSGDEVSTSEVAYLYDGTEDIVYNYLASREDIRLTAINAGSDVTAESLRAFDVVVVGAGIPADGAALQAVRESVAWVPVLNLNASLYPVLGYGEATTAYSMFAKVTNVNYALFKNVELISEDDITALQVSESQETLPAVLLGDFFAGDAVVAVGMEDTDAPTLIHQHNANHNGYIYLPYAADYTEAAIQVLGNAIGLLADSKRDITAAQAPSISRVYKNLFTEVTIKAPSLPKAQVYYTLDGSDPTTASTLYEGTFSVDKPCTVKAAAIAEGYTLSEVAQLDIEIKEQPKTPVISYDMQEGQTIVELTCESAEAVVWYNFENSTDTVKSAKYVDPFVINMPQNVTAFAVVAGEVWSEVTTERVLVRNPRVVIDVTGHYRAAKWDDKSNGDGIFAWGKSAQSAYEEGEDEIAIDPETGEEIIVPGRGPLKEPEVRDEPGDDPKWLIKSYGQSILWQNTGASTDKIGTNEGGYYPTVAEDIDPLFPITSYDIQFYRIFSGEEPNGSIESKTKYQAPLDVVVLANMQGGPLLVQVSADGEQWETIGDEIAKTGYSRMWKKYTRSYDGDGEVFIRLAQRSGDAGAKVFDIYVAVAGEESQKLLDELNEELSGIMTTTSSASQVPEGIYTLGGMRVSELQHGLNIIVSGDGTVRKVVVR